MKFAKLVTPIVALSGLAAAGSACAGEMWEMDRPAFYIGGGIGYDWLSGGQAPNQPDDLKGNNTTYKIPFGWRYNEMFGVEGQYINFGTNDNGNNKIKADGWTAELTAGVPVTPHFIPYAKAGALFWNADRRFVTGSPASQAERDGNGTDFTWGTGARFPITQNIALRLEYERFTFGDVDSGSPNFDHVDGPKANMVSSAVIFSF
jgi:opacity protein-like surface antigen